MSTAQTDLASAQAWQLVKEHGITDVFDTFPVALGECGADVFLRLGNGQVLGYWPSSDYGPSYWALYDDQAAA